MQGGEYLHMSFPVFSVSSTETDFVCSILFPFIDTKRHTPKTCAKRKQNCNPSDTRVGSHPVSYQSRELVYRVCKCIMRHCRYIILSQIRLNVNIREALNKSRHTSYLLIFRSFGQPLCRLHRHLPPPGEITYCTKAP